MVLSASPLDGEVLPLVELEPDPTVERVGRAARYRTEVRQFSTPDGLSHLIAGRGLAGRLEAAIEVDAALWNTGRGHELACRPHDHRQRAHLHADRSRQRRIAAGHPGCRFQADRIGGVVPAPLTGWGLSIVARRHMGTSLSFAGSMGPPTASNGTPESIWVSWGLVRLNLRGGGLSSRSAGA